MRQMLRGALSSAYDSLLSDKYATRTAEHLLAFMMLVWGISVLLFVPLKAAIYGPMLEIAPYWAWGLFAAIAGGLRVIALILNGSWWPTPEVRLLCAVYGAMFWIAKSYCYYIAISHHDAADFPMRRVLLVFIAFELFAAYKCGHDIGMRAKSEVLNQTS